jgi:cytochrome c oxidase subunit IV
MSQEQHHNHISSYKSHFIVLLVLLILTGITVGVTSLNLGRFDTIIALLIAATKATIVLLWFMHLKFDNKLYGILTALVFVLFILIIIFTFFDYSYR